jgi:hypothetical protein
MNDPGLFVAGVLVFLVVAAALALLVWGAILDGREQERQRVLARRGCADDPALVPIDDYLPPRAA